MVLFVWFVIGAITGCLVGQVLKGRAFGPIGNSVVGVIGAWCGGFLTAPFFKMPYVVNSSNLASLAIAFLGALIATVVVRPLRSAVGVSFTTHHWRS